MFTNCYGQITPFQVDIVKDLRLIMRQLRLGQSIFSLITEH